MMRSEYTYKIVFGVVLVDIISLVIPIYLRAYPEFLPGGRDPTSYLIIFVHIPAAWNMFAAFTITFIGSILYLARENIRYDLLSLSSTVIGIIYGIVAIVTGMLWANEVWGSPWNWDPRETATLVMLLAYIGYISLRASISDPERVRTFSSVYAIAAYVTLPITYISAVIFQSLHEQLPRQPLTSIMYSMLGIRVVIGFIAFILVLLLYYRNLMGKVEVIG